MIAIDIPGHVHLELAHLVVNYSGTLAVDGVLLAGVAERLRDLATRLTIHVITADTFDCAATNLKGLPVSLEIVAPQDQVVAKVDYIATLGVNRVVAIGNGRNDLRMVEAAALGIVVLQAEGACTATLLKADVVCTSILDALDLLHEPRRLVATMRS
jgi:soluble P-type ATPase